MKKNRQSQQRNRRYKKKQMEILELRNTIAKIQEAQWTSSTT